MLSLPYEVSQHSPEDVDAPGLMPLRHGCRPGHLQLCGFRVCRSLDLAEVPCVSYFLACPGTLEPYIYTHTLSMAIAAILEEEITPYFPNLIRFLPKDPNMFDEFRESYLQDDTTSIFMQPYSKYLVGVNALILALIVPGVANQWSGYSCENNNRKSKGITIPIGLFNKLIQHFMI